MSHRFFILITCLTLLLGSCSNLPEIVESAEPIPFLAGDSTPIPAALVIAPPDATPTSTPFLPIAPTPTLAPTEIPPTPVPTLTPTYPPFEPLATSTPFYDAFSGYGGGNYGPMGLLEQPPNQINILLMGSDQRPNDGGFRTDVLVLVTMNTDLATVNLTSFPRDLYVYIPGWTMDRINTAQVRGGFQLTAQTFEYNFGVRPDHWAMVNFDGFVSLIDSLGGIEVEVGEKLVDHRDQYGKYVMRPGMREMDGETALWYVRSRKSTNDFERTERQQEVLKAIFYRLVSLDAVGRAPELYKEYQQTILTDLTLGDILPLLPLAPQLRDNGNIQHYAIGPEEVTPWISYGGAQVLLPDQLAVRAVMERALNIR
jgi:LCP family protein required for cell wall assembly